MSKFKTCWQYQFNIEDCEKNSGEVLVTENECLSVREILERFSKGIPVGEQYRDLDDGTIINEEDIDSIQSPDYSADKADMALFVELTTRNMVHKSKTNSKTAEGDGKEREREQASEQSEQASEQTNDLSDPSAVKE